MINSFSHFWVCAELLQIIKKNEAKRRSGKEKQKLRNLIKVITRTWLEKVGGTQPINI